MLDFTNADKMLRSVLAFQSTPNAKATLDTCPKCGFDTTMGPAECKVYGKESEILPGAEHVCGITIIGDYIKYDPSKPGGGVTGCLIMGKTNKLILGEYLFGKPSYLYDDLNGSK